MPESKVDKMLQSAAAIVRREGVTDLTLEAVAKEAGVSKGGLLYHFPSKDALITAMFSKAMTQYIDSVQSRAERDTGMSGRWCRAYVEDTFDLLQGGQDMSAGLLAAIALNPQLLSRLQEQNDEWQKRMESDGIDPVTASIAKLAADGLWFAELMGLVPLRPELREQVRVALVHLTKEEVEG